MPYLSGLSPAWWPIPSDPFVCCPQGYPCGHYTEPQRECHCTPRQVQQYLGRISGPLNAVNRVPGTERNPVQLSEGPQRGKQRRKTRGTAVARREIPQCMRPFPFHVTYLLSFTAVP